MTLLVFAGLTTGSGGAVSIGDIQDALLKDVPGALERFNRHEAYFGLSTFTGLIGGALFAIYPIALTVWLGRVFVALSLCYLILGCAGLLAPFSIAFNASYWTVVFVAASTQLAGISFYFQYTKLDGWIILILAAATVGWALLEMLMLET